VRLINLAHTPGANGREDFVRTKLVASQQGHAIQSILPFGTAERNGSVQLVGNLEVETRTAIIPNRFRYSTLKLLCPMARRTDGAAQPRCEGNHSSAQLMHSGVTQQHFRRAETISPLGLRQPGVSLREPWRTAVFRRRPAGRKQAKR
jgi:hypothetical protein